ncbi:hypothetical protein D3C87_866600 [compost metagenome]
MAHAKMAINYNLTNHHTSIPHLPSSILHLPSFYAFPFGMQRKISCINSNIFRMNS